MKKGGLILLALFTVVSCDLLFNKDSDTFVPASDIQLAALKTVPGAKQGEVVTFQITVKNGGFGDVKEPIEINLRDQGEGVAIGKKMLASGLASNDSTTLSFEWDTGDLNLGEHLIIAGHTYSDENPSNDSLSTILLVTEPDVTDIAVTHLKLPDTVVEGDVVEVEVTVRNTGNQAISEPYTLSVDDLTSGNSIGTRTSEEGLAIGDSAKMVFSWDTQGYSIGTHELLAVHDFEDGNPINDEKLRTVLVAEAPLPDIAITGIEAPSEVIQGEDVRVAVTVRNVGKKDATKDFKVNLKDQSENLEIASQTISGGLAFGNSVVISFIWDTQSAGIGQHTLKAYHDFPDENNSNDRRTFGVMINEVPVTDIALVEFNGPATAIQGDNVSLSLRVENLGNQDVSSEIKVTLTDQTDGESIATQTIKDGLLAGNSAELNFTWNTDMVSIGNHNLSVTHNLNDDDNGNNTTGLTVFIDEPPFIDLELASLSVPSSATQGDQVAVSVRIENRGNRDVTNDIKITLTDDTDKFVIHTWTLSGGLQEGDSKVLNYNWDTGTATLGDHTLIVSHDLDDDKSDNNSRNTLFRIDEPIFLDIGITNVDAPSSLSIGKTVTLGVTLQNLGNRDINVAISVTVIDQTSGNTLGTQTLSGGMVKGASVSLGFVWNTKSETLGNHRLVIRHNYSDDNPTNDTRFVDIELVKI